MTTLTPTGTATAANSNAGDLTDQKWSSTALLANGGWVVTWTDGSGRDGDDYYGVRAQVFSASGQKVGTDFGVNPPAPGIQWLGKATGLAGGGFVITWWDWQGDSSGDGVRAQLFNADGSKVGSYFIVNTVTRGYQNQPAISALADGGFVVAWTDDVYSGVDTSGTSVAAQVFSASGAKVGGQLQVNTTTAGYQGVPQVATLSSGDFVVLFRDAAALASNIGSGAVRGQLFHADGSKAGGEFLALQTTGGSYIPTGVAALAGGGFVLVATDSSHAAGDPSGSGVVAQVFGADGSPRGATVLANTSTTGDQRDGAVAALPNGGFVVAWTDAPLNAEVGSVRAQLFTATGAKDGGEFTIGSGITAWSSIAVAANGTAVISWDLVGGGTGHYDVQTQRLAYTGALQAGVDRSAPAGGGTVTGTAGDDTLRGSSGADTFYPLGGHDTIDGGAGRDTVVFAAAAAQYTVTRSGTTVTVQQRDVPGNTATLTNVERLQFADGSKVALDVDGNGGMAYSLYQAAFNRTPDKAGLGFQINSLDSGAALQQVAQSFIDSAEFSKTYGSLNTTQFVTQLYANVLHRAPDAAGLAFHVGTIDGGGATARAATLVSFSESAENQAALIGTIQNGMDYL